MNDERRRSIWELYRSHVRAGGESRDYLPYSPRLNLMRRVFNSRCGARYGIREFWRHVINTLRMTKRARAGIA